MGSDLRDIPKETINDFVPATSADQDILGDIWIMSRQFRASSAFALIVVCIANFTDVLMYGLVVPVLPFALSHRFGLPEKEAQEWNSVLLGTYTLAVAVGSITFGWLGDLASSRKVTFMLGLFFLGVSTVAFALARSLWLLELARIVQGFSSSIATVVGSALILDKVGTDNIGQALGWRGVSSSLAFFAGPVLGGVLYDFVNYEAVFFPILILVGIELVLRPLVIEGNDHRDKLNPEEGLDAEASTYGTIVPRDERDREVSGANEEPDVGDTERPLKRRHPAILILLTTPRMLVVMFAMAVLASFVGALEAVLPLFCHDIFGLESARIGLFFIPFTIPAFLGPLLGKVIDRTGTKRPATLVFAAVALNYVAMSLIRHDTLVGIVIMCIVMFVSGLAWIVGVQTLGCEVPKVVGDLENRSKGIFGASGAISTAYGMTNFSLAAGTTLGTMYGGFIGANFGWTVMSLIMAGLSALVTVLVWMKVGTRPAESSD